MTVKIKSNLSDYPRAWDAKVSLINSGIPGRKSKDYYVGHYKYLNSRGTMRRVFTDDRPPLTGYEDFSAVHGTMSTDQIPFIGAPWPGDMADELLETATSALFAAVQKTRDTNFNGAVFLGELPSTWNMFVGTAGRVVNAYRAARRGDLAAARRALGIPKGSKTSKGFANNLLELQYGWLPLLSDIDSAARKLADRIRKRPVVFRASGTSHTSRTHVYPVHDFVDSLRTSPGQRTITENFSARVGVSYTVSDETVALASELGFTNPALIAWELLPLSFVLDWIISVGDWLQAISTFHGLQFYDGYQSVKGDVVTVTTIPGYTTTGYKSRSVGYNPDGSEQRITIPDYFHESGASFIRSSTSGFRRWPMSAFPSAPLPKLDPKGSWKKGMTSWALLRQRMR